MAETVQVDTIQSEQFAERIAELGRICRTATQEAQQRNRELGVPNVYSLNGRLYYEWPNGELRLEPPLAWYAPPKKPQGEEAAGAES